MSVEARPVEVQVAVNAGSADESVSAMETGLQTVVASYRAKR